MHRDERPSKKNGAPRLYGRVLTLLALLLLTPAAAHAQWTTDGSGNAVTTPGVNNVGVGASNPAEKLTVAGSIVAKGSSAIAGSQFIMTNNDTTGPWIGVHTDSSGNSTANYAAPRLSMQAAGMFFQTSPAAAAGAARTWTTRLAVNGSDGNVGIGTSSPGAKLDVRGSIAIDATVPAAHAATNYSSLWLKNNVALISEVFTGYSVVTLGTNYQRGGSGWTNVDTSIPAWSLSFGGGPGYDLFELNHSPSGTYTRSTFMVVNSSGNVGIGTASPSQRLQLGAATTTGTMTPDAISLGGTYSTAAGVNPKLRLFDDGASVYGLGVSASQFDFMTPAATRYVWNVNGVEKMRLDAAGNVTVAGNIAAKYQDVAEWVPSTQKLSAGTVVVLDKNEVNHVLASTAAYDTKVAGVVSAQPGVILGVGGEGKLKVATTGRVRVKVDATRAPVEVGDLLVTSDVEGLAMKSVEVDLGGVKIHRPGTIIGKALEPLEKGTGEILVLLSLQ
jgi:hypothetical protein